MKLLGIKRVLFGSLKRGDDLYRGLLRVITDAGIKCGAIFVIGALDRINLGYSNLHSKSYDTVNIEGMFELTSGMGNITVDESGDVILHLHIVVQNAAGDTYAGHVLEGNRVGITAEYIILEFEGVVERRLDKEMGLKLVP